MEPLISLIVHVQPSPSLDLLLLITPPPPTVMRMMTSIQHGMIRLPGIILVLTVMNRKVVD
jgi:hypothetical protein